MSYQTGDCFISKLSAIKALEEFICGLNITDDISFAKGFNEGIETAIAIIRIMPPLSGITAVNGTSGDLFEQIKWERDVAIQQLKELGYGFGEEIIHCKDCEYWGDEDNCPMCYTEKIEWDEGDGFIESEYILHNQADPTGFCNAMMER